MAEDWAINVRKYAPDAEDAAIAGIVRYCGIALRKPDSALVSFTDAKETARVRQNYCRKKLGLDHDDAHIDAAIARVGERMRDDSTRNRVTVYYLLADEFGKLGLFGAAGAAGGAGAASLMSTPAAAARDDERALAPTPAPAPPGSGSGVGAGFVLAVAGGLAAIIVGTATIGSLAGGRSDAGAVATAPPADFSTPVAAAPMAAPAAPAVPAGAGVIGQDVEGMPMVSVYFDTAKTAIAPGFTTAVAPVKAWIDSHPGDRLGVSGFNDSRGNAAFNAELSKNRAKAVAAELARNGVPADRVDLDKPPETTGTGADLSQSRRVDIVVKPGG